MTHFILNEFYFSHRLFLLVSFVAFLKIRPRRHHISLSHTQRNSIVWDKSQRKFIMDTKRFSFKSFIFICSFTFFLSVYVIKKNKDEEFPLVVVKCERYYMSESGRMHSAHIERTQFERPFISLLLICYKWMWVLVCMSPSMRVAVLGRYHQRLFNAIRWSRKFTWCCFCFLFTLSVWRTNRTYSIRILIADFYHFDKMEIIWRDCFFFALMWNSPQDYSIHIIQHIWKPLSKNRTFKFNPFE